MRIDDDPDTTCVCGDTLDEHDDGDECSVCDCIMFEAVGS